MLSRIMHPSLSYSVRTNHPENLTFSKRGAASSGLYLLVEHTITWIDWLG